ncbi:MAG: ATPase domain-containing protein [Thermoproteus sp.]
MGCSLHDIFASGVIVIKGLPGAGKTLLAAKAASTAKNAVWFTFYETEERLRRYLASANITPPAHIFDLVSAGDIKAAVEFIVNKAAELKPDFVVVDGLSVLGAEGERELVHALFYHGISRDTPVILIKEGLDVTPADYIADSIIEVHHRIHEGGASYRYVRIAKARGMSIRHYQLPYVISDSGPVVVAPSESARPPTTERLTTGAPEVDEAIGGGVLRGSLVAVVGPADGLASKLMVLTASELARRGSKVLYHHHKAYPTFVKFAEALGVKWRRQGITWFYHSVSEHRSLEWWYKAARLVDEGSFDVHMADQYEAVVATAGEDVVAEGARIYQETLRRPVVTVLVVNSHYIWRRAARGIRSLVDYIFIFRPGLLRVYAPELPTPLEFQYVVDWAGRRVVFKKSG